MGKYVPKIKNFFIILDASSSMSVSYAGKGDGTDSKLTVAKDFIRHMNNTMPAMEVSGVLRTFGRGIEVPMKQTETVYGRTTYSRSGLEQSINSINFIAEGNSPAGLAIKAVSDTIGSIKGANVVIFISDGEHLEGDPLAKVRDMGNSYGDWTCFYTVWIGNNPEGGLFMEELAGEMDCGFSKSVDDIASNEDMIDFVKQVFLTTDIDSDRDGVPDSLDKCPDTPIGVDVDESGCPKVVQTDSDGDGVFDDVDKCPDTPIGVDVDESGCPKVVQTDSDGDGVFDDVDKCPDTPVGAIVDDRGCWVVKGVQFDYKKWNVKPQFNSNLDNIENILINNPGLKIRIDGHTDDIGSMKYNIDLSGKRAQAIKDYLVGKGIDSSRITTKGLGYAQPIADNDTPNGRALNRRAEIIPVK
ncbi:MAG: OmpA family protein [Candidatus Scalindua sp.]|nr:OmpA family protein [Candidatus Scalindua sp.]MCR4343135.1 OmpA family protein [Candidatus Scalindua sp.]